MRTFIGFDFDKETKDAISKVQGIVRHNSTKGRFKYVGNFHLTLKFLGEIEPARTANIGKALKAAAASCDKFSLNIDRLGFFNGRGSIHALWLGLGGELDSLNTLYEKVEEGLANIGIKRESRPFTPHITIAQDILLNMSFEELREKVSMDVFKPITVKELQLIKSEEIGGKRIYTPILTFPLR